MKSKAKQSKQGESSDEEDSPIEKEKPCFEPSGILAEYQNKVNGIILKFTEPLDSASPQEQWLLYPFKGDESYGIFL